MDTAAVSVTEKEDREESMHEQDIFDGVVLFLAALTFGLLRRVLGRTMRRSVPSWAKGGHRRDSWFGNAGCGLLLQRNDYGGGVGLRDTASLREGGQRASRGVAEGTECRQQRRQEDVNPLMRFALNHPEQAPLHDLERIRFQGDQDEQEPIFWCREGAVLLDGKPTSGPWFPIHLPRRHIPTVSLDAISLVASSCGYYRGHIEHRVAH